jgi:catechol-2,3-dioxygenase
MIAGGNVTTVVTDLGRAIRFYTETLGMKLVTESVGWAEIDAGDGFIIGLHPAKVGAPKAAAHTGQSPVSVGLRVKGQLGDVVSVLENRGITFHLQTDAAVKLAFFADPDGNPLYLYQVTA